LTALAKASSFGIVTISVQSNLIANGFAVANGTTEWSSSFGMTATGTVGFLPPTAIINVISDMVAVGIVTVRAASVLSAQSNMTVAGFNATQASAVLSGQSTLVAVGKATAQGIATLSTQVNMNTVATTATTPPSAILSSQSNMTVIGSVIVKGFATLTIQSSIVANAKLTIRGVTTLSSQSSIVTIGTRAVRGAAVLSAQTNLVTVAFVPARINGTVRLSTEISITVKGKSTPPWVSGYIEIEKLKLTRSDNSKATVTAGHESKSRIDTTERTIVSTISFTEGG
jgi:hypothetical protein